MSTITKRSTFFTYRTFFFFLLILGIFPLQAQKEQDFFTMPTYQLTKNLVQDYDVDNDFDTDDSAQMQRAINDISKNGGGKLIIPAGNYSFIDIEVKSNIHIEVHSAAVIRPTEYLEMSKNGKFKNYKIFSFGSKASIAENVLFTSNEKTKRCTIDLTQATNKRVAVFALRNIENFLFSDISIQDNQTVFSSFTLGVTTHKEGHFFPRNGIIKNCTTTNADYGYGLVQVQAGKNILFKNISGQGGVTLRLETGETKMNNLQKGGVHDIFGYNIECHDGNAGVMISPHAMHNGIVTIDGVTTTNCGFGVRIGAAFISKKYRQDIGLINGTFDPKSSVKNVKSTFGETAQVKPKHFKYIPAKYQTVQRTAETPITNVHSNPEATESKHAVFAVSVAAVGYFTGKEVVCLNGKGKNKNYEAGYTINIDESTIEAIGFTEQKPIIDNTDNVLEECTAKE